MDRHRRAIPDLVDHQPLRRAHLWRSWPTLMTLIAVVLIMAAGFVAFRRRRGAR
jgi:LPXTG-motif cell wall-anchored protein